MMAEQLKEALVEIKRTCLTCNNCADCLFGIRMPFGFNRCMFNPFMYTGAFPRDWKIEEGKENKNEENKNDQTD